MRVLERGIPPESSLIRIRCGHCSSLLVVDVDKEARPIEDTTGRHFQFKCMVCDWLLRYYPGGKA